MTQRSKNSTQTKQKPQLSIEDQEIQLRRTSAQKASFPIKILHEYNYPFSNYEILGEKNIRYTVEIRSLDEKINSCSCPDYHVNTLGTCKHIESVLHFRTYIV